MLSKFSGFKAVLTGLRTGVTKTTNCRRLGIDNLQPVAPALRLLRAGLVLALIVFICGYLDQSHGRVVDFGGFNFRGFYFIERYAYDIRMRLLTRYNMAPAKLAEQQVVVLSYDENTFADSNPERLPGPPVPRDYHARVVRELTRAGAKTIVFDLLFAKSQPQDQELATAFRASGHVIIACKKDEVSDKFILPVSPLRENAAFGHVNVDLATERPEVDRIPLTLSDGSRKIPSLCWQAANQGTTETKKEPEALDNNLLIVYPGKPGPGETFPHIAYEQVYKGDPFLRGNQFFKNKIVFIGDTRPLSNDFKFTPVGLMSGVEILACATNSLLYTRQTGFTLREITAAGQFALMICLALVVTLMAAYWPVRLAIVTIVAIMAGYCVLNVWLFMNHGIWLHLIAPLVAGLLATVGTFTERSWFEEREKKRVHSLLRRYVSPQVADYVVANPEKCILGSGEETIITVLFSDIRGFTSLSEKLTPTEVVERLNEYLQAMTDIVFKHDGTLDKYVGDAIVAFYGAPIPYNDHARRAVATALDMQAALLDLQAKWIEEGLPVIEIGIGVNTGSMVVGNIGARERLDFTVIGDAVNLASRVESLTKELHGRILITQSTFDLINDQIEVEGPYSAPVKGKSDDVKVYKPLNWKNVSKNCNQ